MYVSKAKRLEWEKHSDVRQHIRSVTFGELPKRLGHFVTGVLGREMGTNFQLGSSDIQM